MMTRTVGVALATLLATFLPQFSGAATVSVGSYTFDDSDFASSAGFVLPLQQGSTGAADTADEDFSTFGKVNISGVGGSRDILELGFDRAVTNGTGVDLLIFDLLGANLVELSTSATGAFVVAQTLEGNVSNPDGGFDLNIQGIDITDLGISSGSTYSGSVFVRASATPVQLAEAANISTAGASAGGPSAVPLHGGVVFLLTCLGALGVVARRRQAAKAKSL